MIWRDRLRELAATLARIDYGSPDAEEKQNAAADELRELIQRVASSSKDEVEELLTFLGDPELRGWIAYGFLEHRPRDPTQRKRCVAVIQEMAKGDSPDGLAAQWWLRDNRKAT